MVRGAESYNLFDCVGFISRGVNADESFYLLSPNVGFATVVYVDLLVRGFPEVPLVGDRGKIIPSLYFIGVIIYRQHHAVGNDDNGTVGVPLATAPLQACLCTEGFP